MCGCSLSYLGSVSLDNRSFRINDEGNIAVYSPEFAREIRELIEEGIEHAEIFTLEGWKNRPWDKRIKLRAGCSPLRLCCRSLQRFAQNNTNKRAGRHHTNHSIRSSIA